MVDQPFHHALKVKEELCQGCTHCMKRCPTQAIRITAGKAHVDAQRCIDCGQCMDVCPHNAIVIEQNDFNQIFSYSHRVAIVPSLLIGQFEDTVSEPEIIDALHHMGFSAVYWAEFGVDILKALGNNISVYADVKPVISSYCPAVVRLIQVRYPTLLPNVNVMRTVGQITALYARALLESQGVGSEQIGIFYITPCAAKYAQIKTPGSATSGLIQGGLNIDSMFNMIQQNLAINSDRNRRAPFIGTATPITKGAFLWSLTKGESAMMQGRTLSVDEVHNVIEFLELVEDQKQENLDFLELRACDTGCTGGVLTPRNRFLATERIKHHARSLPNELPLEVVKSIKELAPHFLRNLKIDRLIAKSPFALDIDTAEALKKLEKIEELTTFLPGIDCGLCGSPTCRAFAEDITRGYVSIRRCVVLKMRGPEGKGNLARVWGEAIAKETQS
ncbi:MAG: [Fe-Fe] hydrogenase large subunit C-terminal domain-containing protein [Sphaerochaetaceae bacterium]